MLTRRSLFKRALGAIGAATLAGVSRWLPVGHPDGDLLDEPDFDAAIREWAPYAKTDLRVFTPMDFDIACDVIWNVPRQ